MSLVQDSRSMRRTATCSPVGRYLARFTVIRPSSPLPAHRRHALDCSMWWDARKLR
uniref:Uncharacterized protein n=2 Tax=Anguilla anguilla TaxID=7936 RepID=A0A0E9UK98_ANGAN